MLTNTELYQELISAKVRIMNRGFNPHHLYLSTRTREKLKKYEKADSEGYLTIGGLYIHELNTLKTDKFIVCVDEIIGNTL